MESVNKKQLIEDIYRMKSGSREQMLLTTFYSLRAYVRSLFVFGINNEATKDNLNVIKEMFSILRTERILLNYILKHIDDFDIDATEKVVRMLDEVNDETVLFYYNVIDDIENAALMEEEFRAKRRKQPVPSLIQSSSYASEVVALGENIDSLKEFLGYEDEFWEYIKKEYKEVNVDINVAEKMVYAAPLLDDEGNVFRVLITGPKVVDLETALLAIQVYKKAHDIYLCIGKKYDEKLCFSSLPLQQKYLEEYISEKANKLLSKKM